MISMHANALIVNEPGFLRKLNDGRTSQITQSVSFFVVISIHSTQANVAFLLDILPIHISKMKREGKIVLSLIIFKTNSK